MLSLPDKPTVISLFAGCDGSSLGYQMAGYQELLAVEWDDHAVATFRLNFPDVPVHHGDIGNLSVAECLRLTGLQPGELDVPDGSPPCQGFSTAGKRQMGDRRNLLFREYCRLLEGLRPKVFIMENVSGMVKGKMRLLTAGIFQELTACGYQVKAQLMNAMYFNVPQSRQRVIFVGVRAGLMSRPSHPMPITRPRCALCAIQQVVEAEVNPYGPRRFNQACRTLRHHLPSPTLTKSEVPGSDLPFAGAQRIGVKAAAIIQSFPAAFEFVGTWTEAVARIGNSVPPLFMKAIAEHVKTEILSRC